MYRTSINGQQVVIRFSFFCTKFDQTKEEQIIRSIINIGEGLLSYKNDCIAISDDRNGLIIVYVQDGEVLDVQIYQVVPNKNILLN